MEKEPIKALELNQKGQFALNTIEDQLAYAQRLMKEEMVSSTFKTPQQVIVGIQYCKALGLEPALGLKMMYVVNGRPCLYSEGPLALCQRTGLIEKMEEFFIDEDYNKICLENKNLKSKVFGAITRVWRKGDDLVQEDYFTLDDLAQAGLDKNSKGQKKDVWQKWERLMLRYKARTIALRSKFADLIAGIPVAEYDFHFSPETPNIKEAQTTEMADKLNEIFLDAKEKKNPGQETAQDIPSEAVPCVS